MRKVMLTLTRSAVFSLIFAVSLIAQGAAESKGNTEFVGFPHSFADLADKVKPAVVNISTTSTVKIGSLFKQFFGQDHGGNSESDDSLEEFFRRFFNETPNKEMKQQSLGSGFIIAKDGLILTNSHVVDNADEIKVKLSDGREFVAKVLGRDAKTDLALIKIASPFANLPVLTLGDSEKMRVGDWVMAVGNPFGLEQTVTQGIISATGRVIGAGPYDNFLQTDAPINPGNSGGPLVNLRGEVVGISTAMFAGGQGLGFAIPSTLASSIVAQLQEKGKVVRGWIGVAIQTVTQDLAESFGLKEPRGALVGDVVPNGPAQKAGIRSGDIITAFDGKKVPSANDLPRMVAQTPVGKKVPATVLREGKEETVTLTVEELKEEKPVVQPKEPPTPLGMKLEDITPQRKEELGIEATAGVLVVAVDDGSAADEAGIQQGDVITEVNRKPVKNLAEYEKAFHAAGKGKAMLLLVKRGKESYFTTLKK